MDNRAVVPGVRALFEAGTATGLSDGQLLERFLRRGDDSAEAAFRALVERHGPMVLRACRGVLRDDHAAEDAFQATFLILSRKAGSIRRRDSVASWLFGVARRVAGRAAMQRSRRAFHERRGAELVGPEARSPSTERAPESSSEVQEEVDRLPELYRAPVVLCYLEGLTQEEAANRLRLPASTVRVRLLRARARLRDRLIRRGLTPGSLAGLASGRAGAPIPAPIVDETVKAAIRFAVGRAAGASGPAAALAEGAIRAMSLARLKIAAALVAVVTVGIVPWRFVPRAGSAQGPAAAPIARQGQGERAPAWHSHLNLFEARLEVARARRKVAEDLLEQAEAEAVAAAAEREYWWDEHDRIVQMRRRMPGAVEPPLVEEVEDRYRMAQAAEREAEAKVIVSRASLDEARAAFREAEARRDDIRAELRVAPESGADRKAAQARIREARRDRARAGRRAASAEIDRAEAERKRAAADVAIRTKVVERLRSLASRRLIEQGTVEKEEQALADARDAEREAEVAAKTARARLQAAEARLEAAEAEVHSIDDPPAAPPPRAPR